MFPLIGILLPSAIHLAESIFSGQPNQGSQKKDLVLSIFGDIYDTYAPKEKILAAIPKALFLEMIGIFIEKLVPQLTA